MTVRPEVKRGQQVPRTLIKLVDESDFTRRALNQARKSASIGSGIKPAVAFVLPGGGVYMLVELEARP